MNAKLIVSLFGIFLATSSFASATVSDVTAKQRWPFSGKVDIDFTLSGEDAVELDYFVKYDGVADWVKLDAVSLSGDVKSAKVGACHAVWDPAKSGFGGKTLTGFSAKVEAASFTDRKFIVVDLQNGGWAYASAAPENGWTQNVYKSTKMVFRRIPGGDYKVGHLSADFGGRWGGSYSTATVHCQHQRDVTISSDYYMAIFTMTEDQCRVICGNAPSGVMTPRTYQMYYSSIRGSTNETDGINWPYTKFKVAPGSILGLLRAKVNNELMIDLPTETQWEVAIRAGTTTVFPAGGTTEEASDADILWGYFNVHSVISKTDTVGLKPPTEWDIYDPLGMTYVWSLDACASTDKEYQVCGWAQEGRDPIGRSIPSGDATLQRIVRNIGWGGSSMNADNYPGLRRVYDPVTQNAGARFCIHLDTSIAD